MNNGYKVKFAEMTQTLCGKRGNVDKCDAYSHRRAVEWWAKNILAECKRKKWSDSRFENLLQNFLQEVDPTFVFKTSIKFEQIPERKAPRF